MIVLRQNQYSTKTTQAIYLTKSAGNKLKGKILGQGKMKSPVRVARESITLRNSLRPESIKGRMIDKALETSKKAEHAMFYPGNAANNAIDFATRKPAAALTYAAITSKVPGLPGTSGIAIATEKVAQKIPGYSKASAFTGRLGDAWKRTKLARSLDKVTGFDAVRYAQAMFPLAM